MASATFDGSKGIVKWATTIHTRLSNDPTRAAFKDLVQVQGFLFLEEYLEQVQAGPREQPVIEIAKTPGRRKDAPKTRALVAAASAKKLKLTASGNKENAVANPLHQALLKAQKEKTLDEVDEPPTATPRKPLRETRAPAPIAPPVDIHSNTPPVTAPLSPPPAKVQRPVSPVKEPPPTHHVPEADLLDMNASTINSPFAILPPTVTHSANTSQDLQDLIGIEVTNNTPTPSYTQDTQPEVTPTNNTQPPPSLFKSTLEAALSSKPSSRLSHLRTRPSNKLSINGVNPPARILHPAVQGLRSPTSRATPPSGSENVTPVSPPSRIPRSPKASAKTGSAPLPPRSPSALRTDLASSMGPDVLARTMRSHTVNPPPVPKMRSSWLTKVLAEDGVAPSAATKKSMGDAIKKPVVGTKRKSEEMEEPAQEVEAPRPSKAVKTVHPTVLPAAKLTSDSDFDEDDEMPEVTDDDVTSFAKLRETIGKVKEMRQLKAKSVHGNQFGVDIDITGRFAPKPPAPEPVPVVAAPVLAQVEPQRPNSASSSRSYERLSISELVSSTDSQGKTQAQEKSKPPATQVPPKPFKLLVDSANGSTTPPHSPPAVTASVIQAKTTVTEKMTKAPAKAADEGYGELSQFEQLVLDLESQPPVTAPAKAVKTVITTKVVQKQVIAAAPAPQPPSPTPVNPFDIPADFFSAPKPTIVPTLSRQPTEVDERRSSTNTSSTAESFTDSLFSQPKMAETFSTQPTEYGMSQEMLVTGSSLPKGKGNAKDVDHDDVVDDDEDLMNMPPPRLVEQRGDDVSYMDQDTTANSAMIGTSFLGSAANFVAKAFGSTKKPKPDHLRVIEAAAEAKKEQERKENAKQDRLKQMEQRRLAASQKVKNNDPDRSRQVDTKRKVEEDSKKRERDDTTTSKIAVKKMKVDEDPSKKRKPTADIRTDMKRVPSKDQMNVSYQASTTAAPPRAPISRPGSQLGQHPSSSQPMVKSIMKKPSGNLNGAGPSGLQGNASGPSFTKLPPGPRGPAAQSQEGQQTEVVAVAMLSTTVATNAKPSHKTPERPSSRLGMQPAHAIRADMQARVQAQLAAKNREEQLASEQIELPDVNSDYSDEEDVDRHKDLPSWAQSPELFEALKRQKDFNPDQLFGPIATLKMEEIFKSRHSRFRARTSSANWSGVDKLTEMEELEYARRMNFK